MYMYFALEIIHTIWIIKNTFSHAMPGHRVLQGRNGSPDSLTLRSFFSSYFFVFHAFQKRVVNPYLSMPNPFKEGQCQRMSQQCSFKTKRELAVYTVVYRRAWRACPTSFLLFFSAQKRKNIFPSLLGSGWARFGLSFPVHFYPWKKKKKR